MENKILYIVFLLFFISCEKEETPIEPFDRGDVTTVAINTGNNGDYSKQIFYSLSNQAIVRTINRITWDLAFETTATGHKVTLNSSNKMLASKTGETDFNAITSLSGLNLTYDWDHSTGNEDSLAFKDWIINDVPTNEVYIVDRGQKPDLSGRGTKKMQILSVTSSDYTIKYANVDGSDEVTKVIPKDVTKNNTCFSFDNGGEVIDVEPNKTDWDLLFTQYTEEFYVVNPTLAYSVNGVLLNRTSCKAVKAFDVDFSGLTFDDISSYTLNDTLDVIGFDWKVFDMDESKYTVYDNKNYLIQGKDSFYYKLRFVDFYNDQGIKGVPTFELEKL